MCGISICISKNGGNVIPKILRSLYQLQNRGYDSAGIAFLIESNFKVYKYASTPIIDSLDELSENMDCIETSAVIGHTRWATHGAKTDTNAHPHVSMNKRIVLVHNGIIENYTNLKKFLSDKNYTFVSDTDTEVVANLIDYYLNSNTIEISIKKACKQLQGTYALAIIHNKSSGIYLTRNGSPMLIGENEHTIIATSEVSGFIGEMHTYITLDNHDILKLDAKGIHKKKIYTPSIISQINEPDTPDPYPFWTIKEINEQPLSLLRSLNNGARILNNTVILGGLQQIASEIDNYDNLILLGCGTSLHACMIAKHYFQQFRSFNTIQVCDGAEFQREDIPINGQSIIILCSQSGETKDLHKCLDICKQVCCLTVGVINTVDSLIAREVDCGIYLNAGREVAVASTKSFTSMLSVLSLISMWFYSNKGKKTLTAKHINLLRIIPEQVQNIIDDDDIKQKCEEISKHIINHNVKSIFLLGKKKMVWVAKEAALKIKELCYIHAEGYGGGSLKHGPFALLEEGSIVFLFIDEPNRSKMLNTYEEVKCRGAICYIISECDDLPIGNSIQIRVPQNKCYQEIMFTVVMQLIAYGISISKGINPDKPKNLAKVVTVE